MLPRDIALLVANSLGGAVSESFVKFRRSIRRKTDAGEVLKVVNIEPLSDAEADSDYLLLTIEERLAAKLPAEQAGAEDSTRALDENFDRQSTNEEMHSVNEELYAVSGEHQRKIEELIHLSLDSERLLKSTEIGAIFLDENMYVRRFTPAAARTFNLMPQDVDWPITHITFRFEGVDFPGVLGEVNRDRAVREAQVKVDGRAYLMRILPYRADGFDEKDAVVAIIDFEALNSAQRKLRELDRRNEAVLSALSESILSWHAETEIVLFCNEVYAAGMNALASEVIGRPLHEIKTPDSCRFVGRPPTARSTSFLTRRRNLDRSPVYSAASCVISRNGSA